MEAISQQFFNLAIMERAFPLLLMGLRRRSLFVLWSFRLGWRGVLHSRSVRFRVSYRALGGDGRH